jgi:S-layer homology domain
VPHTPVRRRIAALAAAALVVLTLLPVTAAPVGAAGGSGFVSMVNGHRNDNGRGPVGLHATIDAIAEERGRHLAEDEELGHDFDYLQRRFDEENICWQGFGEIVAHNGSGDFSAFGTQWMNSTTHRNIMLGDYSHAGGSREEVDGRWYGVMVFVKLCGASGSTPTTSGFIDLGSSTFVDDIEWLVENEITSGCAPNRFCPRDPVARGEMATFLQRAFDYPGTSEDFFSDDETSTHELAINRTREAGVTSGCAASRFCPLGTVTRGQMASFLARALDLPPASEDHFSDDDDSIHENDINRLAEAGIASGCSSSRFCPDRPVTRGQMAAFLHRALD